MKNFVFLKRATFSSTRIIRGFQHFVPPRSKNPCEFSVKAALPPPRSVLMVVSAVQAAKRGLVTVLLTVLLNMGSMVSRSIWIEALNCRPFEVK